jgi:hypothetical protein
MLDGQFNLKLRKFALTITSIKQKPFMTLTSRTLICLTAPIALKRPKSSRFLASIESGDEVSAGILGLGASRRAH